jgi:hypothetical protein
MTLLQQAERSATDPSRRGDAMKGYLRAIDLFPDTSAAAVAQRRLKQMSAPANERSRANELDGEEERVRHETDLARCISDCVHA